MIPEQAVDVTIIGAGPAGLSAARVLAAAGLRAVLVLERNEEAGGLPRFCGHPGWGLRDLGRVLRGPDYARALVRRGGGAALRVNASVLRIEAGGAVEVSTPEGIWRVASRAVLLATGTRETPRGARLTGGARPWGVTTTGAFQEMAYAGQAVPFRRPVIVGSELVAFSALLTARHAGVRPVAILEEAARIVAPRPAGLAARLWFGVPVLTGARLVAVLGGARVEGVAIEQSGLRREIACDGVIFSGKFIPESFLARTSGVAIDAGTGGPVIDTAYRCSMDRVFAAGNVLRPVEHSGVAALEGVAAARAILRALRHTLPPRALGVPVRAGGALRYVYPQLLLPEPGRVRLLGRARVAHRGWLRLVVDGRTLARRPADVLPERRIGLWVSPDALRAARAVELVLD